MADRSAHQYLDTQGGIRTKSYPIADGVTLYHHALVGIEGGYANHWADGTNDVLGGLAIQGDDRTGDGSGWLGETDDTPDPRVTVLEGCIVMHLATIAGVTLAQTHVGDLVYCPDSDLASLDYQSSGNNYPIGYICEFRTATDFDIQLFTSAEMLAQATA